jgi:hypothetical protein
MEWSTSRGRKTLNPGRAEPPPGQDTRQRVPALPQGRAEDKPHPVPDAGCGAGCRVMFAKIKAFNIARDPAVRRMPALSRF